MYNGCETTHLVDLITSYTPEDASAKYLSILTPDFSVSRNDKGNR
jgi:hypothetical protein